MYRIVSHATLVNVCVRIMLGVIFLTKTRCDARREIHTHFWRQTWMVLTHSGPMCHTIKRHTIMSRFWSLNTVCATWSAIQIAHRTKNYTGKTHYLFSAKSRMYLFIKRIEDGLLPSKTKPSSWTSSHSPILACIGCKNRRIYFFCNTGFV